MFDDLCDCSAGVRIAGLVGIILEAGWLEITAEKPHQADFPGINQTRGLGVGCSVSFLSGAVTASPEAQT